MNLTHLKYIVEVERQGSITRAAQALYMGQPNLSKAIKETELEVGITIFRRSAKGVVPTEKGREFLRYAKAIIVQVDKMEQLYKDGGGERTELSVFVSGSEYAAEAFARTVSASDMSRRSELRLDEGSPSEAAGAVIECGCALAVVRTPLTAEGFLAALGGRHGLKAQELYGYALTVLAAPESPLAALDEASPEVLAELTEITGEETPSGVRGREPFSPRRIFVRDRADRLALLRALAEGYMYSAPVSAEALGRYGLIQRRCAEPRAVRELLITRESTRLTPAEQTFVTELVRAAKGLM